MTKRAWFLVFAALSTGRPAFSVPILNEVFYDAAGADAPLVFTEISGRPGASLDGWSLVGVNGASAEAYRVVDLTGAVIPLDGLLLVATASAEGDVLRNRDFVADVDWQNGPDIVELWDALGVRVDALQYGDLAGITLGEGSPAPDAAAGLALTRDFFANDTDDNALDFVVADPTPGSRGVPPPEPAPEPLPEPRSVTLLASGLAALWLRRRPAAGSKHPTRGVGRARRGQDDRDAKRISGYLDSGAPASIWSFRTMMSKPSKR